MSARTYPTTSLGALATAMGSDGERAAWLRAHLRNGAWFTGSLPAILDNVAEVRNPAAHAEAVTREAVTQLRAQLVGVGCKGALVELAGVG